MVRVFELALDLRMALGSGSALVSALALESVLGSVLASVLGSVLALVLALVLESGLGLVSSSVIKRNLTEVLN